MKRISLRLKLSIIILLLILVEGVLIGYISFSNTRALAIENKKQEIKDTVNRIDINMNVKTRFLMDSLDDWVEKENLTEFIKYEDIKEKKEKITEYNNYIKNILGSESAMIIAMKEQKPYIYGIDYIEDKEIKKLNSELRLKKDRTIWFGKAEYKNRDINKSFVRLAKPLFENGKYIGFIILDVETDMIGSLLEGNRSLYEYQYIFTLDKENKLISSSTSIDEKLYTEVAQMFRNGAKQFKVEYEGNVYYVAGQYNGITGWVNYELIRDEALFPNSKELVENILITVMLSIIITGISIFVFTYILLKPVEKLSSAMRMVYDGDFSIRLNPKSNDEISRLMLSFNFMLDKINVLINEVYYEKLAKKEAELKALQAQINPHFLYNTLDSINWMLIEKGEMEISENIVSVGRIIRYCIDDSKSFVSIAEELEYVKAYLKIQKNRLEDKFDFDIVVDKNIENEEIPKLILQPLIENSLIHGIEPFKNKGFIRVNIAKKKDKISFIIEDNGNGIKEDILKNILSDKPIIKNNEKRIGVKNVIKRLKLYYGSEYEFIINTKAGMGTQIELLLPKRSKL